MVKPPGDVYGPNLQIATIPIMFAAVEGDDAIEAEILHAKRPKLFRQIEPSLIMDKTNQASWTGTAYVRGFASGDVLAADLELSFWGGIDPWKGEVIDRHPPLSGRSLAGKILAIPGGRGSCSGSGVMLELLLNGKGPAAMLELDRG